MTTKGTFPTVKYQFRASVFSEGDTENRIMGFRVRHKAVTQNLFLNFSLWHIADETLIIFANPKTA